MSPKVLSAAAPSRNHIFRNYASPSVKPLGRRMLRIAAGVCQSKLTGSLAERNSQPNFAWRPV
jgi:hypothetical protein